MSEHLSRLRPPDTADQERLDRQIDAIVASSQRRPGRNVALVAAAAAVVAGGVIAYAVAGRDSPDERVPVAVADCTTTVKRGNEFYVDVGYPVRDAVKTSETVALSECGDTDPRRSGSYFPPDARRARLHRIPGIPTERAIAVRTNGRKSLFVSERLPARAYARLMARIAE